MKEKDFERLLQKVAGYLRCLYIKIPDQHCINAETRKRNREDKRPFDAVLCTPKGNFAIECKINYNKAKLHQDYYLGTINALNGMAYIIRAVQLKSGWEYRIEKNENKVLITRKIEDIILYFLNWEEER